jgi:hypothetical protein
MENVVYFLGGFNSESLLCLRLGENASNGSRAFFLCNVPGVSLRRITLDCDCLRDGADSGNGAEAEEKHETPK